MTKLETFNQAAFLHLNADLSTAAWKLNIASFIAEYLIYVIPLGIMALWCWGSKSQRKLGLRACAVTLLSLAINQLLAIVSPHPRPFVMGMGHTFIPHATDSSYPSDHVTVFGSIGLTMVIANIRSLAGWGILILGAGVAWARVFLAVHFPLDMVGAVVVAGVVWVGIRPIWLKVGEGWTVQAVAIYRVLLGRRIALGWIRG